MGISPIGDIYHGGPYPWGKKPKHVKPKSQKKLAQIALKAATGDTKAAESLLNYMSAPKIALIPLKPVKGKRRFPRLKDKEVWHNGFHLITPEHMIGSLSTAKTEISYSNYDCANLDRLREILYRYCEEHNIPLGQPLDETEG